jgi:DNA-binding response OmpR family regulator
MGAYDYLAKPCEIDELEAKIRDAWVAKGDGDGQRFKAR